MAREQRPLSEHQRRIQLLSHLGFIPGKSMGLGQAVVTWHFGTNNGAPLPGLNPLHVPSWRIAQFLCYYAPSKMVDNALRTSLETEYRLGR